MIASYQPVLTRLLQDGALSFGILIFATQDDLLLEHQGYVTFVMSDEINFHLLVTVVEVINDIVGGVGDSGLGDVARQSYE